MKRISLALIFLLTGVLAFAQGYPNGLSADTVDPEADARFISEMKAKMDKVRRTQQRPTVALVLSGGGARGSAHVGVMKVLEEMRIPIDMICGTSMGGLMGGLYSMGYTADQLDSLLKEQDWNLTLSDDISPRYKPYKEKEYRSKYVLTVPFHYENAADNPKHIKALDLGISVQLVEIADTQGKIGVGKQLNGLRLFETHEQLRHILLNCTLLQQIRKLMRRLN